jgi:membrane-anchored protein YejM (alkaline phosphatase superfamily)
VDLLLEDGYQMELFTSARFTYPEFDRTVWARVSPERMHEAQKGFGWERDRENVTRILQFLDDRDPGKPFMTFEFFESPHARYYCPPESIIRRPYLEEMNYATMDLERDIGLIKNRYINSCHHLDMQIERILQYLDGHGLMSSTIILITGDHGEEFLEHGRWGHNSTFSEEQIRVPFVLWVPGRQPEVVDRMTSHLDIAPTLLRISGVENPLRDCTLGFDLFGAERRQYTVLANWDGIAYVDDRFTGVFPLSALGFTERIDRRKTGDQTADPVEFLAQARPRLIEVMKDLKRFFR